MLTDEQNDGTQADADDTTTDDEKLVLDDLYPNTKTDDTTSTKTTDTKTDDTDKATQDEAAKEARLLAKVQQTVRDTIAESTSASDKRTGREREITKFLTSDEGKAYAQYTEQITKVATDPRFADLSMDRVVGMALTPKTLIKIGAKLAKEAKEESQASEVGGSSGGEMPKKDVWDMPPSEFEKMQQEALSGKFLKK